MHGHHDGTFMPTPLVLTEAASTISEPFSEMWRFPFALPFRAVRDLHPTLERW
jgi:hypothetical protein